MYRFSLTQCKYACFITLLLSVFVLPVVTEAFYADSEISSGQQFTASQLQLEPLPDTLTLPVWSTSTAATTVVAVDLVENSLSAQYDFEVVAASGDLTFCDALQLELSSLDYDYEVSGLASNFGSGALETVGDWQLGVVPITSAELVEGQTCEFTFAVTAWQSNMTKKTAGYRDTASFTVLVTATESAAARVFTAPLLAAEVIATDAKPAAVPAATEEAGESNPAPEQAPAAGQELVTPASGDTAEQTTDSSDTGATEPTVPAPTEEVTTEEDEQLVDEAEEPVEQIDPEPQVDTLIEESQPDPDPIPESTDESNTREDTEPAVPEPEPALIEPEPRALETPPV